MLKVLITTEKIHNYVWWWMLTRHIVGIISEYTQILNYYMDIWNKYMSIISQLKQPVGQKVGGWYLVL